MCRAPKGTKYSEKLANLLDIVVSKSQESSAADSELTVFDAQVAPQLSVKTYLSNWVSCARPAEDVFCVVGVYIDRLTTKTGIKLTPRNIHRVVLACLLVATKWHSEDILANTAYARIGGVAAQELLRLESAFLLETDWDTHVSPAEFAKYATQLSR
eukprot:TRINITY_DN1165_c0_g2_i1.p1 TRINITY_DN1165_c0_g2~~TRINITY_DN1165_c0_g2_i1.p1  ORF type:complete len:184 (+),score=58.19 TRINITY_DN1165_c0_g2_i1:83-553(+)